MTLRYSFKTALIGLGTHKSRSALTILGIVIGITAIMIVMSLGSGAEELIVGQIQGMGSRTIAVIPGREPTGPSDFAQVFSNSLREKDLIALQRKENVPTLGSLMPVVFGGETTSYGSETYRTTIFGGTPLISEIFNLEAGKGTFFTDDDVRSAASVIVIGNKVKTELFGLSDAVGERIKVGGHSFRVLGVLPKKGQVSFFNFDDMVIVPYTTAQSYVLGKKYFDRIIIQADSDENVSKTVRDVEATLRESHNIVDIAKDDFFVQTQEDIVNSLKTVTSALTVLLAAVAAISLVVGGIGIMNIMLVSVTERTREIGLRKSIGATNSDILTQFLLEAVVLTGVGGVVGITLGGTISFMASLVISRFIGLDWSFSMPLTAIALGLGVSSGIGLIFGLYPARQAAKKSPIEALRYE